MEDNSTPQIKIDTNTLRQLLTVGGVISLCLAALLFLFVYIKSNTIDFLNPPLTGQPKAAKLFAFKNAEEFSAYIQKGQEISAPGYFGGVGRATDLSFNAMEKAVGQGAPAAAAAPNRVSETNVQVKGIDEPDIVKTNGKQIYFSPQFFGILYDRAVPPLQTKELSTGSGIAMPTDISIYPPQRQVGETSIIDAFPPETLAKIGKVDANGELLLDQNRLIVLSFDKLTAFDVTDPKNPQKAWEKEFDNSNLVSSRLKEGKLITITRTNVNIASPCPMPLFKGTSAITVPCERIYYPDQTISVDSTYTISLINAQTGSVDNTVSFVGSSGQSTVYVSANAVYTTYTYPGDILAFFHSFLQEKVSDLIPTAVINRLGEIKNYNISHTSKIHELQVTLEQYKASLSKDDALKLENELTNRMTDYSKAHARELESTGIVKVNIPNLEVLTSGAAPGHPINQFALDEFEGNLRIATTTGQSFFASSESVNDVYVMNSSMQIIGSLLNLGVGEQIYSARFIEDKAYLVTFKQVDPFFVIDLKNPRNPTKAGELKIPGFSSYLHPISENHILGVGQEDGKVKLSLFDVSNPQNPIEISKYSLNDYWSEVSSNHHAFLQDAKHEVFFLPGGNGGYIFSYKNNTLTLEKAVSDTFAKRAIYLNDYLYIIGENKIVVLDEANWQTVKSLSL